MIIQVLAEGENFGMDIVKKVEAITANEVTLLQGSLYPALHELEKEGLVVSWESGIYKGRPRLYYKLTRAGRKVANRNKEIASQLYWLTPKRASHETKEKKE